MIERRTDPGTGSGTRVEMRVDSAICHDSGVPRSGEKRAVGPCMTTGNVSQRIETPVKRYSSGINDF
ncbi:MAG: hypothetical protein PHF70_10575 [Opitutales bacterium]|nr:hypothetical protein [Opitutales bacterium]